MQLPMARILEKHGRTTRSAFQTLHQIISFQNVHLLGVKDSVRNQEMLLYINAHLQPQLLEVRWTPPHVYIPTHTCSKNTIGKQDRTWHMSCGTDCVMQSCNVILTHHLNQSSYAYVFHLWTPWTFATPRLSKRPCNEIRMVRQVVDLRAR